MKSKIFISVSLFLVAFIFSSFMTPNTDFVTLNSEIPTSSYSKNQSISVVSCAKCHDCTSQNYAVEPLQSNFVNFKESVNSKNNDVPNKNFIWSENIEVDDYMYPDSFKNSFKN